MSEQQPKSSRSPSYKLKRLPRTKAELAELDSLRMDRVRAEIFKAWTNSTDAERREALWLKYELTYEIEKELTSHAN